VVLNELVQNAVEHGLGDGHGTVTIELRGGGDQPVVLEVRDDGAGPAPHPPGEGAGPPVSAGGAAHPPGPEPGPPVGERSPTGEGAGSAVHSPSPSPTGEGAGTVVHSPGGGLSSRGGLGLRLVRALVEEELNGWFTLTHPAGRGSIATAVLPPVERRE
jgi:two-component sensor histidine kinase